MLFSILFKTKQLSLRRQETVVESGKKWVKHLIECFTYCPVLGAVHGAQSADSLHFNMKSF